MYVEAEEMVTPMISAGGYHSLAVHKDGTTWSWGSNRLGQLGDGTRENRHSPVQVIGLNNLQAISTGYEHNLALKNDNTVWTWGDNFWGQLGDGTRGTRNYRHTPIQVNSFSSVKSISTIYYHCLILKDDDTLWGWGKNWTGQLGQDTEEVYKLTPLQIKGLSNLQNISAGGKHSLVLKNDGTVWGWGCNGRGQLGVGTLIQGSYSPVQVKGLSSVHSISAGRNYSIALKDDGTVWSWGGNYYGQLGDGTTEHRRSPVQVSNLTDVKAINAGTGLGHSLALKNDGTVWAWGYNKNGQLGDGTREDRHTPVQVSGLIDVIAISAGDKHSLALQADGTVWAWGNNTYGQLGDGTIETRLIPVKSLINLGEITPPPPFSSEEQNPYAVRPVISPRQPVINQEIVFDASRARMDSEIVSYEWNFGDGTTAEDKTATHSYSQKGRYRVTIVIKDDTGATEWDRFYVTVKAHQLEKEINDFLSLTEGHLNWLKQKNNKIGREGDFFYNSIINRKPLHDAGLILLDSIVGASDIYDGYKKQHALAGNIRSGKRVLMGLYPESFNEDHLYHMFLTGAAQAIDMRAATITIPVESFKMVMGSLKDMQDVYTSGLVPAFNDHIELAYMPKLKTAKDDLLLSHSSEMSEELIELYKRDLELRAGANYLLSKNNNHIKTILKSKRDDYESKGKGSVELFANKKALTIRYNTLKSTIFVASFAKEMFTHTRDICLQGRMASLADGAIINSGSLSQRIFLNSVGALEHISADVMPTIATGNIVGKTDKENLTSRHKASFPDESWKVYANVVADSYTQVRLRNTGPVPTFYELTTTWHKYGIPQVTKNYATVLPGLTKTVNVYYKKDHFGKAPVKGTPIDLNVIGTTHSGTYLVAVDSWTFNPDSIILDSAPLSYNSRDQEQTSINLTSGLQSAENATLPVSSRVEHSPRDYEYALKIYVENPTNRAFTALISQDLPNSITITDNDGGNYIESQLTWDITLEPGEIQWFDVRFTSSIEPEREVEFSGTQMQVWDQEGLKLAELQTDSFSFEQRVPLFAEYQFPEKFELNESYVLPVTITNLLAEENIHGELVISLEKNGNEQKLFTQNLIIGPGETKETLTSFTLNVEAGNYKLYGYFDAGVNSKALFSKNISLDVGHLYGKVNLQGNNSPENLEVMLGDYKTKTSLDGTYIFNSIPKGNYLLKIEHPNYIKHEENVVIETVAKNVPDIYLALEKQPPIAFFSYSDDKKIYYAYSSYSPDDEIVSYHWDFGDGNKAEGEVVEHILSEPGTYKVKLTVTDSRGLEDVMEKSETIEVADELPLKTDRFSDNVMVTVAVLIIALVILSVVARRILI